MKKAEAEQGIRQLCSMWAREKGYSMTAEEHPSFYEFYDWVEANYPRFLDFRDSVGVRQTVEQWFDEEFRQTWRN